MQIDKPLLAKWWHRLLASLHASGNEWLRVGVFVVMRGVNNMVAHCDQTLKGVDAGVPTSVDLRHRKGSDY